MPIPNRKTFPTDRDDLIVVQTDDGSHTLQSVGTNDLYHSGCGAKAETEHVYLGNSNVTARLQRQQPTRVLEIGLGTSMGMLMSMDLAQRHHAALSYVALELDWISAQTLAFLQPQQWLSQFSNAGSEFGAAPNDLLHQYNAFREKLPAQVPEGDYHWQLDPLRQLTVVVGDLLNWKVASVAPFDAIFYDPFSAGSAPELWDEACFAKMRSVALPHTRLVTYCCSRKVRDALHAAAWDVQRVPGPVGGKREVLYAVPRADSPPID